MRARPRPLRLKLTLWFVLVFAAIQATLVGGVVWHRRESIRLSRDAELEKAAEHMVDNILAAGIDLRQPETVQVGPDLVPAGADFRLFVLRDAEGRTIYAWNVPDPELLPFTDWEAGPQGGPLGRVFTSYLGKEAAAREGAGGPTQLRLVTLPFRKESELYFFQAAVRDQVLSQLFGPFLDLVVIGIPIGLLAGVLAAWIIAGRAVAPIQSLSAAAATVTPRSLGERIRITSSDEEVSLLEDELNSALERLEAAYEAQEQFLSNVSHELKTPVAVLLTQAQVLDLPPDAPEPVRAFASSVEREMKRLGKLVESLLALTRADISKTRFTERVSVDDVVLEAVGLGQPIAVLRDIRLVPRLADDDDGPRPEVIGDPALLATMLENLVRNAVHHSPRGEAVSIAASCTNGTVAIAVSDRGPGIPAEYLGKVFDRFVQAPREGEPGGHGLGLAIASTIAHLHEGSIDAANLPEGGCSMVVTLPLAEA